MVASKTLGISQQSIGRSFQSPSLRGSGRFHTTISANNNAAGFQSPSLRGSGRFAFLWVPGAILRYAGFNPLHCGAVVASHAKGGNIWIGALVSIPFIAGQWSLPGCCPPWTPPPPVSIPFIAGQWSLHFLMVFDILLRVVSIPFIAGQWSLPHQRRNPSLVHPRRFNPLHCGAVVASGRGQ